MTNRSSPAEAPAASPARQPGRWLVLAAVPLVMAFAAARGVHAGRGPGAEQARPPPESEPVQAEPLVQPEPLPQAEPLVQPELTFSRPEPLQSEQRPEREPPPPQSIVPPELTSFQPAPPLPRSVASALPRPAAPPPVAATGASAGSTGDELPEPEECEPTPLTPTRLAEVLRDGHIRHFGAPPHADRWACAWAHCAFEQRRGGAIYGNNLGHITAPLPPGTPAGTRPPGRACRRRMHERLVKSPDRWALVDLWFRVFDTPEEGAEAYWRLLANSYYSVIARCDAADARGAAQRLAEIGYFTGPEEPYIEGMARLFVSARGSLIPRVMAASQRPPALLELPPDHN